MKKTTKAFIGSDADSFFCYHNNPDLEFEDECYDEYYKAPYAELCNRKGGPVDLENIERTDPDLVAMAEAAGFEVREVESGREYMIYHDLHEGEVVLYKDEIRWFKS